MTHTTNKLILLSVTICIITSLGTTIQAQSILARKISLNLQNQPLGKVMDLMEQKGQFGFSYTSKIIPRDSIVNLHADALTIKEALDLLLDEKYEYKETKSFIVLRYAPCRLVLRTDKSWGDSNEYTIAGYVTDELSGEKLHNASVYERNLAKATLTDQDGYFEIRLHHIYQPIALTISKENYKDVTTYYLSEVSVQQKRKNNTEDYETGDFEDILNTGMGKFLTTSKQRIQSLNLGGIIASAPYQVSITPALNTHGDFSGQIVNEVSFNLVGGYNAGVKGAELGVIYNINKMNVSGAQLAGLFNIVGGSVSGFQLAGIYNDIGNKVTGVQLAGIKNNVKGYRSGIQIAGLFNNVQKNSSGLQLAGLFNSVKGKVTGIQMAGLFNQAGELRGLQIGLINMVGSSSGYSIGLLNFIHNGFNKVSLTYNETLNLNLALKTGNKKLYTIWLAGLNVKKDEKLYGLGLGLGTGLSMTKRFFVSPEISSQYLYQGNWKDLNLLHKFNLGLNLKISQGLTLNAGPTVNLYYSDQQNPVNNYAYLLNRKDDFNFSNNKLRGWIGWNAGITIF